MVASSAIKGNMLGKTQRELTHDDIERIGKLVEKHQEGEKIEELGVAKCVTKSEFGDNDYSFVPGRYVGSAEIVIDKEGIKQEIQVLANDLDDLLQEFNSLVPNVKEAINKILNEEESDER